MYIKMYGCYRVPSLFPIYATNFVIHKEVVRKVFINGIGSYLHDHKKASFPLFPFCIGAYKFSRIKGVEDFVKGLEVFHFGEKSFMKNDRRKKIVKHCVHRLKCILNMNTSLIRMKCS